LPLHTRRELAALSSFHYRANRFRTLGTLEGALAATGNSGNGGAIEPRIFGEFTNYQGLVVALRNCKDARGVSYATIDDVGGMSAGMASKILAPRGERRVTWQNLEWLCGALCCKLLVVTDDGALHRLNGRLVKRNAATARDSVHIILSKQFFREIGRKGAAARWGK
jgi:hypothetical protein